MAAPTVTAEDFGPEKPYGPPTEPKKEPTALGYVGGKLVEGAREAIRRDLEGGEVLSREGVAGVPESILRAFAPREWVDMAFPPGSKPQYNDPKVNYKDPISGKSITKPLSQLNREAIDTVLPKEDPGKAPGPISESFGAMAEGVGSLVGNPAGAPMKVGRALMMAGGSGLGSLYGRWAGESAGEVMGGETGKEVGGVAGSLVGGAVGGQANVTRGKALTKAGEYLGIIKKAAIDEEARKAIEGNLNNRYAKMSEKSKGLIQDWVNVRLARSMSKDAVTTEQRVSEIEAAEARLGLTGEKSLNFDLAQKTGDPALLQAYATQQPRNLAEGAAAATRNQTQKKGLIDAFNQFFDSKPTAKSVAESLEEYRKATEVKVRALETEGLKERDAVPHMDPNAKNALGKARDNWYDQQKGAMKVTRDGWYAQVKTADALAPTQFKVGELEKATKGVVEETLSRLQGDVVPEAIVKLKSLLDKAKSVPDKRELVKDEHGITRTKIIPGRPAEPITVDDMMDFEKALNRERPRDDTEARNIAIIRGAVDKVWKQAPEDVQKAFQEAQKNYRTLYAPMFKEGVNANLDRNAPRSRQGEGYYSPDRAFDPYLDRKDIVTKMEQFDNLWSGAKGGKRVDEAYQALGKSIQDRYWREVFGKDKVNPADHTEFMRDYEPVFQRVPWAQEAIEKQFKRVTDLQDQVKQSRAEFGDVTRSPLNQTLGVDKANALVSKAMVDPVAMKRLINVMRPHGGNEALLKDITKRINLYRDGAFDPFEMEKVVTKGRDGLMTLYTDLYGPQKAAEQMQNLKDIALLAKRQTLIEAKKLPPATRVGDDPIRGASGSSGASWMSYFRSFSQGYTSGPYIGTLAAGRFFNRALQNALQDAEQEAFNNPEMAKAVLEAYSKEVGTPLNAKVFKTIFSSARMGGKDASMRFFSWALDRGYTLQTTTKGAQIGAVTNKEEDSDQ